MTLALAGSTSAAKWATKLSSGQAAESLLVDDQIRRGGGGRIIGAETSDGFALVQPEGRDVDEAGDVRRVGTERRHDLSCVGMTHDDGRSVLPSKSLAQAGDIVAKGGQWELRGGDFVALRLQAFYDGTPARSVCESSVNQDDSGLLGHVSAPWSHSSF
jgi:hypothetical protein